MKTLRQYLSELENSVMYGSVPSNVYFALCEFNREYKDKQRSESSAQVKVQIPKHEISTIKDTLVHALSKLNNGVGRDGGPDEISARIRVHEAITQCDELLRR